MVNEKSIGRIVEGLKDLVHVPQLARLFIALMADGRVPLWLKIAAGSGVVYVVSPLDIIPDHITGIGYLDDIIVALLIVQTFVEMAPDAVVAEHCHRMGIPREHVRVNISRAVSTSVGAIMPLLEGRGGSGNGRRDVPHGSYTTDAPQEPAGDDAPATASSEPRYKRYSAYSTPSTQE